MTEQKNKRAFERGEFASVLGKLLWNCSSPSCPLIIIESSSQYRTLESTVFKKKKKNQSLKTHNTKSKLSKW